MRTDVNFTKILLKVTYLGLFMNVITPIIMAVAASFILDKNIAGGVDFNLPDDSTLKILFYGLLGVSVIDGIVTHILRKKIPEKFYKSDQGTVVERFEKAVMNVSIIVYSFNMSYSIYGLVLVILGADIGVMMLFLAFSLVGYQIFRPRQKYLENLLARLESAGDRPV